MMNLAQLKDKLSPGKLASLLSGRNKEHIHPSEVAHMLNSLPLKSAVDTFLELPDASQLLLFNFLGSYLQQSMIGAMPKEKAVFLLNRLNSTDRYTFYSSLNDLQRSTF